MNWEGLFFLIVGYLAACIVRRIKENTENA